MHIADLERGMLGANGIVGAGIPLATGAALTAKIKQTGGVAVAFFGDGATNQGSSTRRSTWPRSGSCRSSSSSRTTATARSTPMEFVAPVRDIAVARRRRTGCRSVIADGMDFFDVYAEGRRGDRAGARAARVRRSSSARPTATTATTSATRSLPHRRKRPSAGRSSAIR